MKSLSLMMIACALVAGCGGRHRRSSTPEQAIREAEATATPEAPPAPPAPPTPARIRIINASPDAAAATLSLYFDESTAPTIPGLAYKAAIGYGNVPSGSHHVAVRGAGGAGEPFAQVTTPSFTEGVPYTLIAHGLTTGEPHMALAAAADDTAPAATGNHTSLRFFHALVGAGAVDVCVAGAGPRDPATAVVGNAEYGAFGSAVGEGARGQWASVTAGSPIKVQLRAANAARPCTGAVAGTAEVTLEAGVSVTALAIGRDGRNGVAKELLICKNGTADCAATALGAAQAPAPAGRARGRRH